MLQRVASKPLCLPTRLGMVHIATHGDAAVNTLARTPFTHPCIARNRTISASLNASQFYSGRDGTARFHKRSPFTSRTPNATVPAQRAIPIRSSDRHAGHRS
jgi:hypothetical protein